MVKTDYRPVPLSHFLWAGNKLHKVLQGNGSFIDKGFADAANALLPASSKDPTKKKSEQRGRPAMGSKQLAWQAQGSKQNWMSLIRFLDRELLTPAVVFSFSKKKCEEIANQLKSLDLNTAKERSAVQAFSLQTVARLSANDAKLPQGRVSFTLPGLLSRIHSHKFVPPRFPYRYVPISLSSAYGLRNGATGHRRPPRWSLANSEGNGGDSFCQESYQDSFRYGNLCDGREHAGESSSVQQHSKARR